MEHACKRCLLLEAGEAASFKSVSDYLETIDSHLKTDGPTYLSRLEKCRQCDNLISGMCLKCGCYVELRAALRDKACPDYSDRKWDKQA